MVQVSSNWSLAQVQLFQGLDAATLASARANCRLRRYSAGQEVFGQLSDNRDVFFVVHGRVRVTIFASIGREVAFRELEQGAAFGEVSAIDGLDRSASVVALEDTALAVMPAERFRALLREQPELAERVLRNFARLIRSLTDRVVEFSTLAVQNRVQAELVRMARSAGVEKNQASLAPVPRHADIASRVATNREAVARELNRLAREGVVERRPKALAVLDFRRLVAMVEGAGESAVA